MQHKIYLKTNKISFMKSKPVGPYSPYRIVGNQLFVSGQIPNDVNVSIKEQTRQVLEKLKALVEQAGFYMTDVVKCTVYLEDIEDFAEMNEVYATFFTEPFPARAAIAVKDIVKKVKVEIDCFAVKQ
ncbi:MAG: deaminase [Candidatus Lokiarchaeota archaeon]|nr:deaminase [Candidatus Lokiarchaeota archaeon]